MTFNSPTIAAITKKQSRIFNFPPLDYKNLVLVKHSSITMRMAIVFMNIWFEIKLPCVHWVTAKICMAAIPRVGCD